jgi:hypothetical protein
MYLHSCIHIYIYIYIYLDAHPHAILALRAKGVEVVLGVIVIRVLRVEKEVIVVVLRQAVPLEGGCCAGAVHRREFLRLQVLYGTSDLYICIYSYTYTYIYIHKICINFVLGLYTHTHTHTHTHLGCELLHLQVACPPAPSPVLTGGGAHRAVTRALGAAAKAVDGVALDAHPHAVLALLATKQSATQQSHALRKRKLYSSTL